MTLDEYENKFGSFVKFDRQDGVITLTLHTDNASFKLNSQALSLLSALWSDVNSDMDNKVAIITGTGDTFCAEMQMGSFGDTTSADFWYRAYSRRTHAIGHAEMDVPMIAAVNGPNLIHPDLALLCDIVIAVDVPELFGDRSHISTGIVPGDINHVVWTELFGYMRGRYLLLTEQCVSTREAHECGVVSEVLTREQLMPRAREIARKLAPQRPLMLRYTKMALNFKLKQIVREGVDTGMLLEALGGQDWKGVPPKV
jgi:enoyl-CoA hydratase/carnithine racemase